MKRRDFLVGVPAAAAGLVVGVAAAKSGFTSSPAIRLPNTGPWDTLRYRKHPSINMYSGKLHENLIQAMAAKYAVYPFE